MMMRLHRKVIKYVAYLKILNMTVYEARGCSGGCLEGVWRVFGSFLEGLLCQIIALSKK